MREVLKQSCYEPLPVAEQIAVLLAAVEGLFDDLPPTAVAEAEARIREVVKGESAELAGRIRDGAELEDDDRTALLKSLREAVEPLKEG